MKLDDFRKKIDVIDRGLVEAFEERMRTAEKIAEYKRDNGLPVADRRRERELLDKITGISSPDLAGYNRILFSSLMELSKDHQRKFNSAESETTRRIKKALAETPAQFPETAVIACQGVSGAYSQAAADRMFKIPKIMFVRSFESVFAAIRSGLCRYGILPLENSIAGSVNRVYDLMTEYNFHIVRSIRMQVNHCSLECLETGIQDYTNNYTRFICISKDLEIYPGADRTSLMMTLEHKPGALYSVLARFNAMGINLEKLESRPIPGRDFEFMFYFDISESVYSDAFPRLIDQLGGMCREFRYLGSYVEVQV